MSYICNKNRSDITLCSCISARLITNVDFVTSLAYVTDLSPHRPQSAYLSRDHVCTRPLRRSSAPAEFVRSGGVRPLRRRSSAPAAFFRVGGASPPRRRSSVPSALVRPVGVDAPRRRWSAPSALVRPVGVRPPRRHSSAPAAFVRPGGVRPALVIVTCIFRLSRLSLRPSLRLSCSNSAPKQFRRRSYDYCNRILSNLTIHKLNFVKT